MGRRYERLGYGATAGASGLITTVFEWVPDYDGEPLPDNVIATEDCSASWGVTSYNGTATGSADNGVGSPYVRNADGLGGYSSGVRYQVKAGAATITLTTTPVVSAYTPGGAIGVSVIYKAAVDPVVCGLQGTTVKADHTEHILIGQGCNASLTAGPCTLQNYTWTIGGDTFKSYEAHGYPEGGNDGFARVTFLSGADLALPSPHWYWRSEGGLGSQIVWVSGSADAYANGVNVGRVTGSRLLTVWAPDYFCGYNATNVTVDVDALTGNVFVGAGDWSHNGIQWTGKAIPPSLFGTARGGIWSFVQTTIGHRSVVENSAQMCDSYNDLPGLDTSYPYDPDGGIQRCDDSNAGWPDDDSEHSSGDSPGYKNVPASVSNVNFSDQFWTYMMYRPRDKGYGNQWVPLHQIAWQWSVNVNQPVNGWALWPPPIPSVQGQVQVTVDSRWTVHPVWTRVIIPKPYVPCP